MFEARCTYITFSTLCMHSIWVHIACMQSMYLLTLFETLIFDIRYVFPLFYLPPSFFLQSPVTFLLFFFLLPFFPFFFFVSCFSSLGDHPSPSFLRNGNSPRLGWVRIELKKEKKGKEEVKRQEYQKDMKQKQKKGKQKKDQENPRGLLLCRGCALQKITATKRIRKRGSVRFWRPC